MTRRLLAVIVASVVLIGVAFVTVFPTGTFLHQSHELAQTQRQLSRLQAQDRALRARAHQLTSNAQIARLAHRDYGLVKPGQEAYVVLPTTTTTTTAPGG
ncbi:MAG TPA: septum formation initiator family protein [Acidimicrobiales bacterium]|nr:septum formation initiator family protein [Acidimicrobiales bacterium]